MKGADPSPVPAPVALRGSLEVFSLWDILQWLGQWSGEGVLELQATPGASGAWIHCRDGCLIAVGGGEPGPAGEGTRTYAPLPGRLGALLVEQGAIDPVGLAAALALQLRLRRPPAERPALGAIALAAGLVTPPQLAEALRDLSRNRLLACLGRGQGVFSLVAGPPPRPGLPLGEPIGALLLRAAEICDASGAVPWASPGAAAEAVPEAVPGAVSGTTGGGPGFA